MDRSDHADSNPVQPGATPGLSAGIKTKCVRFMDTREMFAIQRGIAASLFDFVRMVSYPLPMKKK